ncbi:MAG: response regulator transcription factor [Dehalococcoidales bacterium]|nr:response regulator transcription factor [Dehalococcoidales bacterium]
MTKITVVIADDHPGFREGLVSSLKHEQDLEVIGVASDGEEALKLVREHKPDVVVLDVTMPKLNGLEATRLIKQECPKTAVLVVTAFGYQSYVLNSLRAGAAGYLLKTTPVSQLVGAIRLVHVGEGVFDFKTVGTLLRRMENGKVKSGIDELQNRQLEVLKLAARGMSNKEIAGSLEITERTVQTHLVSIFKKLGVSSRTEAVLRALREGWITLDDLPANENN